MKKKIHVELQNDQNNLRKNGSVLTETNFNCNSIKMDVVIVNLIGEKNSL